MKHIFSTFVLIISTVATTPTANSAGIQRLFEGFNSPLLTKARMVKVTPFNLHCYDKGPKRRFSSLSSQSEQPHKDESKWRKEEFYSPTFWVRLSGATAGIAITGVIAWWTYEFEKNQEARTEHITFLSKTRDYMNDQLKENNELFSELFADAVYKQGIFQHFKSFHEKEQNTKRYLVLSEKIQRSLKYYNSLEERLKASPGLYRRADLMKSLHVDLKNQKENLIIANYLNRCLFYIELENHALAKKNLEELISAYLESTQYSTNDKDCLLSTLYNLKALSRIKESHLTSKSKEELVNAFKHILEEDLAAAEKFDVNNSHVYEHKFFLYLTLTKYERLSDPQPYRREIEKNAVKCYSLAPKNPASLNVMGLYKFSVLDYFAALNYFEKASTLMQNYPPLLHNLAMTHLSLGRKNNQLHHFQTALEYAEMAKNRNHDYKSIGIYIEALAESGKCRECYEAFEMFKEVCAESTACKRKEKLKSYENLIREKCKE